MTDANEYGIVANSVGTDGVFRIGAKVWVAGGMNGGAESLTWYGLNTSGRNIEKWAKIKRFKNFRVAWIPEHLREKIHVRGSKEDMDVLCAALARSASQVAIISP